MKLGLKTGVSLRLLVVPAFALGLAACGGGSSGVEEELDPIIEDPLGDVDFDGIPNESDVDLTGGVDNNFNGVDDAFESLAGLDTDADGITDDIDVDQTGGVDENFNGIDDAFEQDQGAVPGGPVAQVCDGSTNGSTDTNSSDADWANNCQLFVGGSHAQSSYSLGVQRALDCLGHPLTPDGIFGPITESAVMAFQTENGLTPDGIDGPGTWGALEDTLEPLPFDANVNAFFVGPYDPDMDGIDNRSPGCEGLILFYQNIGDGSWQLEDSPGDGVPNFAAFSTGF